MNTARVLDHIKTRFPDAVLDSGELSGDLQVSVSPDSFRQLMRFLHDDPQLGYGFLTDIIGIDHIPKTPRFVLVYILFALDGFRRLIVRLGANEDRPVPSVTGIWKSADWLEREVYDLLGIRFSGHPDLRRILTWENFDGHPLRKDFPLRGKDFDKPFDPETVVIE